jgi:hypothetical protein
VGYVVTRLMQMSQPQTAPLRPARDGVWGHRYDQGQVVAAYLDIEANSEAASLKILSFGRSLLTWLPPSYDAWLDRTWNGEEERSADREQVRKEHQESGAQTSRLW